MALTLHPETNFLPIMNKTQKLFAFGSLFAVVAVSAQEVVRTPEGVKNFIRMQNVKIFARANNPFLISNFKLWDVELGEDGFNYPIQRTFAVGLNVSF